MRIESEHNGITFGDKCWAIFGKDPMKPLDQWQTLEEICREAQA